MKVKTVITLCWLLMLATATVAPAQKTIDYSSANRPNGNLGLRGQVTRPLAEKIPVIINFVFVVLALVSLGVAGKIYTRWQEGDTNVIPMITRWFFGMLLTLALLFFLQAYYKTQDLSVKPNLEVPR
jgi:hypothetical protein